MIPMPEAPILLATDLDRTLIPNGRQTESAEARPRFRRLCALPEVTLVYVTGRHRALVEEAMADYELPRPDYVIGDVGASIYRVTADGWLPDVAWRDILAKDWAGCGHACLEHLLADMPELHLQEAGKQGPLKLSYYAPADQEVAALLARVRARIAPAGARCNLVWSVDETSVTGLLDVLPASAGKYAALDFLRHELNIPLDRAVFAGDSGNDLEVLASPVPSVLVANAQAGVRDEAVAQALGAGTGSALYLATGGLGGMNGYYGAGILEGVAHFIPELRAWLEA